MLSDAFIDYSPIGTVPVSYKTLHHKITQSLEGARSSAAFKFSRRLGNTAAKTPAKSQSYMSILTHDFLSSRLCKILWLDVSLDTEMGPGRYYFPSSVFKEEYSKGYVACLERLALWIKLLKHP